MSKLEAYKAQVDRLLNEGVWNAVVILRELQAVGYTGGYTILREYIAPKRVMRSGRRTVRFETPARQHLQSDWGEINTLIDGTETKVYFIVNELWPTRDAFIFGARRVWMPSTPTKRWGRRGGGSIGSIRTQARPSFKRASSIWPPPTVSRSGYTGISCRTNGKDERMVAYIKQHFFVRYRAFESWGHLNQLAEHLRLASQVPHFFIAWLQPSMPWKGIRTIFAPCAPTAATSLPQSRALVPVP